MRSDVRQLLRDVADIIVTCPSEFEQVGVCWLKDANGQLMVREIHAPAAILDHANTKSLLGFFVHEAVKRKMASPTAGIIDIARLLMDRDDLAAWYMDPQVWWPKEFAARMFKATTTIPNKNQRRNARAHAAADFLRSVANGGPINRSEEHLADRQTLARVRAPKPPETFQRVVARKQNKIKVGKIPGVWRAR